MSRYDLLSAAAGAPLDKTASMVRDGSGEGPNDRKKRDNLTSRNPLRTNPPKPSDPIEPGFRLGKLTVIGKLDKEFYGLKAKKARWVVRCACSLFEVRTTKFLNSGNAERSMCSVCDSRSQMLQGHDVSFNPKMGD